MKNFRPTLVLIFIASIVPELLTGSTILAGFLNPGNLVILVIGYGIAVLVVREFAVRNHLDYKGLFILGLGYAIINEGLMSKTMTSQFNLPVPFYSNYGYFFGISFPWAAGISVWHAVASVLFPILTTYYFFPKFKNEPWLGKKTVIFLTVLVIGFASLVFFGKAKSVGMPAQFAALLGLMLVCGFIAKFFFTAPANDYNSTQSINLKPFWLGLSTFFIYTVALDFIAVKKLPVPIYFFVLIAAAWVYLHILKKYNWLTTENLLLFTIGFYLRTALETLVYAFFLSPIVIATTVPSIIALIFFAFRIRTQSNSIRINS